MALLSIRETYFQIEGTVHELFAKPIIDQTRLIEIQIFAFLDFSCNISCCLNPYNPFHA